MDDETFESAIGKVALLTLRCAKYIDPASLNRASTGEGAEDAVLVSAYSWAAVSGSRFSCEGRMNCHAAKIAASTA
jgi:hypothetical protein